MTILSGVSREKLGRSPLFAGFKMQLSPDLACDYTAVGTNINSAAYFLEDELRDKSFKAIQKTRVTRLTLESGPKTQSGFFILMILPNQGSLGART
jgi:hypothetical protein